MLLDKFLLLAPHVVLGVGFPATASSFGWRLEHGEKSCFQQALPSPK